MKRTRKYILPVCLFALLALALTGCGSAVKSEADIKDDISGYGCLPEGMEIKDIDISLRQTDKKETDEVWVTVSAVEGGVDCTLSYELSYEYYDKGGWVLETVQRDDDGEWEISGVDESVILDDLSKYSDSYLQQTTVTDSGITYEGPSQDMTEYDATVSVESENENVSCEMEYSLVYTLTGDGWELSSVSGQILRAIPRNSMSEDEVIAYVSSMYSNELQYEYDEPDYENGAETHYVSLLTRHNYMTQRDIMAVRCTFDQDNLCWGISSCDELDTVYDWDMLGTWTCSGEYVHEGILGSFTYPYSATVTVTQVDGSTMQTVYDVVGFFIYENDISGTVYFDLTENPYHKATQLSGEQWYLGSEEIDAYAIIKFDADEGLKLSKDGFGAMVCTRN